MYYMIIFSLGLPNPPRGEHEVGILLIHIATDLCLSWPKVLEHGRALGCPG